MRRNFFAQLSSTDSASSSTERDSHSLTLLKASLLEFERRRQYDLARTTAAMALSFIVVVTPWTLEEVIALSTGHRVSLEGWIKPPMGLDFVEKLVVARGTKKSRSSVLILLVWLKMQAKDILLALPKCTRISYVIPLLLSISDNAPFVSFWKFVWATAFAKRSTYLEKLYRRKVSSDILN